MIVKIGVGVLVYHDNKVLLGRRKNSHGHGEWALPGGHLEYGETPEQCAIREVAEETDLTISQVKRGPWTNDFFAKEGKHYITLFMLAPYQGGDVKLNEPDKCDGWQWVSWDALPDGLFLPLDSLVKLGFTLPVESQTFAV